MCQHPVSHSHLGAVLLPANKPNQTKFIREKKKKKDHVDKFSLLHELKYTHSYTLNQIDKENKISSVFLSCMITKF